MPAACDTRIPLTIVTGFLGSGKTTVIRYLLQDARFANAAIIVNEFGEAGIDHHLLRKTDERTTLLRAGCACCARRDDLVDALLDIVRRVDRGDTPPVDQVLLETTGLADPAPILHTIVADPLLRHRFRVARVIATFDAVAGVMNFERFGEAFRQLAAADVVILTKLDLATEESGDGLRAIVGRVNPVAAVIVSDHGAVDLDRLLDEDGGSLLVPTAGGPAPAPPPLHAPGSGVASLTMEFAKPLDWRMLGVWLTMLLHCHGSQVLRVKGLLDVGNGGPLLLEGVQHVVHAPHHLAAWPDDNRRSRLIVITRDLPPGRIRDSLAAFQGLAADDRD